MGKFIAATTTIGPAACPGARDGSTRLTAAGNISRESRRIEARSILATVLVVTMFSTISTALAAQCPKPAHDGKRTTASGKISSIRTNADGQSSVELRGCDDLVILMRQAPGCKVGRTVTVTGRYDDCDYFEWGEVCWNGVLENAKGSCK